MLLCRKVKVYGEVIAAAPRLTTTRTLVAFSDGDDYQFMQRSRLQTGHFQKSLPRLPIPPLSTTCDRFLAATKPITSSSEYQEAEKAVVDFQNGIGFELHALLKQHDEANKHTSYISEPWFDMYLSDRQPLPLNYNPLLVMQHDTRPEYQDQLIRTTNLIISSMRFWRSLQADCLEPEIFHLNPQKSNTTNFKQLIRFVPSPVATYAAYAFKAFPLDMVQYKSLFGVSRIPEQGKDRLVRNPESKHIMVIMGGNIYAMDLLDEVNNIVSPSAILSRLRTIMELNSQRGPAKVPIGALTATERNHWAHIREHMITISEKNKKLLEEQVDSALFCVCLDNVEDPIYNEFEPELLLKNFLAGEGRNRWYDKSVSLLIGADGTAAINFEHSWGDGVAVLRYLNEIYNETLSNPIVSKATPSEVYSDAANNGVRALEFDADAKIRAAVEQALTSNKETTNTLDMNILRFSKLNRQICKLHSISPDAIMQLSFQLAYRLAFKQYTGTYESCSTAAFRHGRTETIRPCTVETKRFCEAVVQPANSKPNFTELYNNIKKCSTLHAELTKNAAMGQGFDRHLFALKHMATVHNVPYPDLYSTVAYEKINRNIISTSTLSSNALLVGCFGPTLKEGLGIGYSIQSEECGAIVTTYKGHCSGKTFASHLEEAFNEIYNILKQCKTL